MYQPTVNRNYRKNKTKQEKKQKARKLYAEGMNTHDISKETGLSEYEIMDAVGLV